MVISKEQLSACLESVRKTMFEFDYNIIQNVIFINLESLYNYMKRFECKDYLINPVTIDEMLNNLEPYIPFALSESTLGCFLDASKSQTPEEMYRLERRFNTHARMDFLNAIRCVATESDWNYIKAACENLRQNYESSVVIEQILV